MHSCIPLTLVFYDHKSSKRLDLVSIWSSDEFSSLCLRFLTIKPISHLTMICYHQNPIRRTLGLISYFVNVAFHARFCDKSYILVLSKFSRLKWKAWFKDKLFCKRLLVTSPCFKHLILYWEEAQFNIGDPLLKSCTFYLKPSRLKVNLSAKVRLNST